MSKVKYCEWCKHDRYTYTQQAVLSSDEHGKVGEFTHYFCETCGYAIESDYRKYSWWVLVGEEAFGPYPFKLEAMEDARKTAGYDVKVRARAGGVE